MPTFGVFLNGFVKKLRPGLEPQTRGSRGERANRYTMEADWEDCRFDETKYYCTVGELAL